MYVHSHVTTYMDVCQGHREVGATGAFCPGPHSAYGPQKDRYTLIEHSNTLLKQVLHIFCPGPLKLSLLP